MKSIAIAVLPILFNVGVVAFGQVPASAVFVRADTTTQGSWKNVYGAQGYLLAADQTSNPSYASPAMLSQLAYTWAGTTSDPRAPQKASNPAERIAATWYSFGSFTIDTNITDQVSHQVALYCLNWDSQSRTQNIDVLDTNGNVVNSQSLTGFAGGVYLVWNVTGHVKFRITNSGLNAVVSGMFFDAGASSPGTVGTASATFLKTDAATKGNWRATFGAEGYTIAGDQVSNPSYAAPAITGLPEWTWNFTTSDSRAPQKGANPADRIASTWYLSSSFIIDMNISDQATHQVALYCLDWDGLGRLQTIEVLDASGKVLNSQSVSGFGSGLYLVWNVSGHVRFRVTNGGPVNAVVSGVFFGGPATAATAAPLGSASFVKTDTTSKGNWRQAYGADGYSVSGDQSLNGVYSAPVVSAPAYTWAASTSDVRGMQKPLNAADQIAATWYSASSFTIDTNISDQATHQVALYCLDWDPAGRVQTIEVLDPNGTVLDTQRLSNFSNGVFVVWNVTGRVKFRITNQGPMNAVVGGIFFGGPSAAPVTNTVPPIPQLQSWEARMVSGGTQFCDANTINGAIGGWGVGTEANVWYYDGAKVYEQIAAYRNDTSWLTCAGYVNKAYSDWVMGVTAGVTGRVGNLFGWRIFPHGALSDFRRTGNATSGEVVKRLANNSAYSQSAGGVSAEESRETAYMINAFVALERMGQPRSPLLAQSVAYALGHIDQWFVSKTAGHIAPFMVGLTMEALINYYELTGDARVPAAIQTAADGLWASAWVASGSAFYYDSVSDQSAAPDLNLLIAPAYAWLWQKTGLAKYMTEGDQVFAGGVLYAGFWSGKQFSQNYRTSFNYVKWRSSMPGAITPLTAFSY